MGCQPRTKGWSGVGHTFSILTWSMACKTKLGLSDRSSGIIVGFCDDSMKGCVIGCISV